MLQILFDEKFLFYLILLSTLFFELKRGFKYGIKSGKESV